MTPGLLAELAARPFRSEFSFTSEAGTYFGAALPLTGTTTVSVTRRHLRADIVNRDNWELRMIQRLPRGTAVPMGGFFRAIAPNMLLGPEAYGSISIDDGNWEGLETAYIGQNNNLGADADGDLLRFSITTLVEHGPGRGNAVSATRHIYAEGGWNRSDTFQGRPLYVRALVNEPVDRESETIAAMIDGGIDIIQAEALWLTLSFVTGNALKHLASELYDEDGDLIRTEYRLGNPSHDARRQFFHRYHGPLAPNGIGIIGDGVARLMRAGFPIEVVLEHLHEAAGRSVDVEAQHLVLAIHAALEGWNQLFGLAEWIDKPIWSPYARRMRHHLIPEELYDDLGEEMRTNIRDALAHANRTTTGWRERQLFERLRIDVTGEDEDRALAVRDELLHNGYFVTRWGNLTQAQRQERHLDVERLRRLVLLVVFKLTAYEGTFMNPITYSPEIVERVPLPPRIAAP